MMEQPASPSDQSPAGLTKQVAKGAGIAFVGQFFGKFMIFGFQIFLSRILGASAYGIYALGYTIHNILTQTLLFGLPNSIVRFASIYHGESDNQRLKGLLRISFIFAVISGVSGGTALYLFSEYLAQQIFRESGLASFIKILAFSLPFYTLFHVFSATARSFRRIDYDVGVREIVNPILKFLFVGLSFLLGARLTGVATGIVLAAVVTSVLGYRFTRRLFPQLISTIRPIYETRRLFAFSISVFFIGFSYLWLTQTDRIMLGWLGQAKDVGIYNAAANVANQTVIFLSAFNAIFAPMIADLYNRRKMEDFETLFKTTTKWIVIFTLPLCLGFLTYSRPIMGLFGPEFTIGWMVLSVLALAQLVNGGVGGVGYILVMTGHQWLELINGIVLGALNIFMNYYLIQRYGALGAGLATGFSIAAINVIRVIEVHSLFSIHPYKFSYYKPVIAGLVTLAAGLTLNRYDVFPGWWWVPGLGCLWLIYAAVLLLLRLDQEDMLVLEAVRNRIFKGKNRWNRPENRF